MAFKSLLHRLNRIQSSQQVYLTLWVCLAIWSYMKGFIPGIQGWGRYLWLIDYSRGFIKRGLVGTVIRQLGYIPGNVPWRGIEVLVLLLHTLTALLTIALLVKIQREFFLENRNIQSRQATILLAASWLLFACTQFWPTLAYNSGYVDVYLLFAYVYAFYLFSREQYLGGAILGCVAVLTHEAFVFLWSSILFVFILVPILKSRRIDRKQLAISCLPLLTAFLVILLHNQAAATSEIRAIPNAIVDSDMKAILINQQFGQTIRSAILAMLQIWQDNTARGFAALAYYTFPTMLMILSIPLLLENRRHLVLEAVLITFIASYLPLSILAIAWDLSRFLVWTNLTTVLTVTYLSTRLLASPAEQSR